MLGPDGIVKWGQSKQPCFVSQEGLRDGAHWRHVPSQALRRTSLKCRAEVAAQSKGKKKKEIQYATSLNQGVREDMQDYLDVVPNAAHGFLYAGVFDGHGGETAAEYLSRHLYHVLASNVDEESLAGKCKEEEQNEDGMCSPDQLSGTLGKAFDVMDNEILQWLEENQTGDEALSGSTATVVLARSDKLIVANIGDSRAVLSRGGEAIDLSAEHRVMEGTEVADDEIERVESVGGWVGDGRVCDILAVSRSFGDRQFKGKGLAGLLEYGVEDEFWDQEFANSIKFTGDPVIATPDVTEMGIREEDEFVILATDGLWDVIESQEAVEFVRKDLQKGRSLQSAADKLANIALRRFSEDNISIIIVDLGGGKEGWGKSWSAWSFLGK